MNKQNLGLMIATIVIGLKFFSIINLTWTIVILFAIVFLLIDLYGGFSINDLYDVALKADSINQSTLDTINELQNELEELKAEVENLQLEIDDLNAFVRPEPVEG